MQRCGKTDNLNDTTTCGNSIAVPINQISMKAYGTTTGTVNASINVNGNIDLIFAIVPSSWYWNGDHFNTYFNASNLDINYTPNENTSPVPEPTTSLLIGIGSALFATTRARKKTR
jgi:hypothetical protein